MAFDLYNLRFFLANDYFRFFTLIKINLKDLTLIFDNIAFSILNTTFLNNNSPAITFLNNISFMPNHIIIRILFHNFSISLFWYDITLWSRHNVSFDYYSFVNGIYLVPFMLVNVTIFILSNFYDVCFELDNVALLIFGNVSLYYWGDSVLFFDIFAMLGDKTTLIIFYGLSNISLNFIGLSLIVLKNFCIDLD